MAATLLSLLSCGGDQQFSEQERCEAFEGMLPICGFQAPEDLALLPDASGILVSEFGHMGESEGQLSILSLPDHQRTVLYNSDSSEDLKVNNAI